MLLYVIDLLYVILSFAALIVEKNMKFLSFTNL